MNWRLSLIELALTLIVSLASSDQFQETPKPSSDLNNHLPPPLLASIFPQLEDEMSNTLPNEEQSINRPEFIKLLVDRLDEQKSFDNNSLPIPERLSITLQDGSFNTVNIEFRPDTASSELVTAWNVIVNLLVDSLAQVIREAEHQGYTARFQHSISVQSVLPFAAPGLSPNALKSAAG